MNIIKNIIKLLKKTFSFKASKQKDLYQLEHLYDETQAMPSTWMNLHGYRDLDNTYYVCGDYRFLGIRIQNVIIECKTEEDYDQWLKVAIQYTESFYERIINNLPYTRGNSIDTCYVFHTTDGKVKEYNVDEKSDLYAKAGFGM